MNNNNTSHFPSRTRQVGFGMFEIILTLAISILASATVWAIAAPASVDSHVFQETGRLNTLVQNVDAAFASKGDFAGVTTSNSVLDGWQAPNLSPNDSPWGTFSLSPETVKVPNDAWGATYTGVPTQACSQLALQALHTNSWFALTIDGQVVSSTTAEAACANPQNPTHTLVFVRYEGTKTGPTSGLQPMCFDRYRHDPRGYEPGCPTADSAYAPAPHTLG